MCATVTVVLLFLPALAHAGWAIGQQDPWPAPNAGPRPELTASLDGSWAFATDPDCKLTPGIVTTAKGIRSIRVPSCWEAAFEDLVGYDGVAWYWRDFEPPVGLREEGRRLFLRFEAVDYAARVWLNGQLLGEHRGGYSPFEFDITEVVHSGANRLILRVVDPAGDPRRSDGLAANEVPGGKQNHYCNIGGLWQSVRLIARGRAFVHSVFVAPTGPETADVRLCLAGEPTAGRVLLSVAPAEGGDAIARAEAPASRLVDLRLDLPGARLWSPDRPYLYLLTARLERHGRVIDAASTRFGMRTVEARDGRLLLNGHPIFLAGALDQAYYPRGIYAPASDGVLATQTRLAKKMGLNFLRAHIKIPVPRYLDFADEQGLMVWDDFPSWYAWNDRVREGVERQMSEWVWRDFNRPSLFAWCLINEEWGMDFEDPSTWQWVKEMWSRVKSWDPTRLVVDNSPAGHGHIVSDIFDQHVYMAIPEGADSWRAWMDEFRTRPRSYWRYPESEERGVEPLVVSEFGNWGLPDVPRLLDFYGGRDPYWFHQAAYAGPVRGGIEAFYDWNLDEVYGDLSGLAEATQRHQWDSLKYEIEVMRLRPSICGYVITQFTDLNSESNGLMDLCRGEKVVTRELRAVQTQSLVVPDLRRRAHLAGETIEVPLHVSHYGEAALTGASVRWAAGERTGDLPVPRVEAGDCRAAGTLRLALPGVDQPTSLRLDLRLLADGGEELGHSYLDLWVIPAQAMRPVQVKQAAVDDEAAADEAVAGALRSLGVSLSAEAEVLISRRLGPEHIGKLEAGARVLLLAEDTQALGPLVSSLSLVSRHAKGRWGAWATSFCWLRRSEAFALRLPYDGHLGMPFVDVVPHVVLDGVTPEQMRDALGGVFVAWMHDPAAIVLPVGVGRGLLLISTLRLTRPAAAGDPVARVVLADLLDAAARLDPQGLGAAPLQYETVSEVLVPTAEMERVEWRYMTDDPGPGWVRTDFDDTGWRTGLAGFGREGTPGAIIGTPWHTPDLWLRRRVSLGAPVKRALLRLHHDEDAELYLNGVLVGQWRDYTTAYRQEELPRRLLGVLRPGENVIALHCHQTVGGQYLDAGILYAPGEEPPCPLESGGFLLRSGTEGGDVWAYTTREPAGDWTAGGFDDRIWPVGLSPFGSPPVPNATATTPWDTPELWLRRSADLPRVPAEMLMRVYHDEDCEVYVNGRRIFAGEGFLTQYRDVPLSPEQCGAFRPGRNIVAVHCRQTAGGQLMDLGLYWK